MSCYNFLKADEVYFCSRMFQSIAMQAMSNKQNKKKPPHTHTPFYEVTYR